MTASSDPFECVGTYSEARYAVSKMIEKEENLPFLLKYYKDNFKLETDGTEIFKYNEINNLSDYYNELVKKEIDKYVNYMQNIN